MATGTEGEVCGKHFASGELVRLAWANGKITEMEGIGAGGSATGATPSQAGASHSEAGAREEVWLAPGLFDAQVNGYGGVDFQQDDLKLGDLISAARGLRNAGCTRFLLTLITDEWKNLMARLEHLRQLREQSAELQAAIAGWHIEGPFLSAEPGFHGAHDPALMCDPTPHHIEELRKITENDPLLLTLSPERPGAIEAIEFAVSKEIKVSLGHTNASWEILQRAVRAGASSFTHLANGCPRELDRHDNILWRVFETPDLTVSLIPDRIHVSPSLFRILHRNLVPDWIYYVSDAMSAAGIPPGRYKLGKLELEVGEDQVVRQPGKSLFAGSALQPIDGVFRAAEMLEHSWQEVWPRFSEIPARMMGLKNELVVGGRADFCVLRVAGRNELVELKTHAAGQPALRHID
jgi:N-acetylglucosamine-6-phosphate deacetylase